MSTPPDDQPALDAAAEDARRIAGDAYYTGCIVHHPGPGRVTLYLAHAPQAVLEELEALHPDVFAILNDAPRSHSAVLEIMEGLFEELRGLEIDFVRFGPTPDGYVQVGILSPFVAAAQARLDAVYGCGVMRVFKTEQAVALGTAATRSARAARSTAARTDASSTA